MDQTLLVEQKYLEKTGLMILIAVLNMVAPLSTDMYMPSFPAMTEYFHTSAATLNLTLVGFFLFFAVGMLIFGPLSDKYGRKPVLIAGLSIYMAFSALCAVSTSVEQLIAFRVVQALGAGCMVSVSTALIKDCFPGKIRDSILATVQSMTVLGPMLAPIAGGFIAQYATWRTSFWALSGIGLLCLIAACFLQEALPPQGRYRGKSFSSLGRLLVITKDRAFSCFLLITSLTSVAFMAYIAVSSYIYINFFHLSETAYSLHFAVNSAVLAIGPMAYIFISGRAAPHKVIAACLIVSLLSGAAVLALGSLSPLAFLLAFMPFTFINSLIRPISTSILLDQQDTDIGSASSLINFGRTVLGSLGMLLGALPWGNFITGVGALALLSSLLALIGWAVFQRSGLKLKAMAG